MALTCVCKGLHQLPWCVYVCVDSLAFYPGTDASSVVMLVCIVLLLPFLSVGEQQVLFQTNSTGNKAHIHTHTHTYMCVSCAHDNDSIESSVRTGAKLRQCDHFLCLSSVPLPISAKCNMRAVAQFPALHFFSLFYKLSCLFHLPDRQ